LGQSVNAIKAIAVSIQHRTNELDPVSAESAKNIERIPNDAYNSVRQMMSNLRPTVLDELGLVPALNNMVDEWNLYHEDTFCRLRIEGEFKNLVDDQEINVFRIIQEGLTNIAKYAQAQQVDVVLTGGEIITLIINDDGVGFVTSEVAQSMGMMGIRERVKTLHGELDISAKPGQGVSIHIEFPRETQFGSQSWRKTIES